MTWNALVDFTTGRLVSASDWNKMMGATGNLSETAVAKATAAGQIPYATGDKALAMLAPVASQLVRFNAAGTAPEAFNPPACRVYHNAAQSVSNSLPLALAFNSERYDTAAMHDTATNNSRLTAPIPGLYLMTINVFYGGNAAGDYNVALYLNNTTYIAFEDERWPAGASNAPAFAIPTVYKLAAGDYVQVLAGQVTGGAVDILAVGNYSPEFTMTWLGPG